MTHSDKSQMTKSAADLWDDVRAMTDKIAAMQVERQKLWSKWKAQEKLETEQQIRHEASNG